MTSFVAERVARRYLQSKGKQKSFVAEYKQAMKALVSGDHVAFAEFAFNTAKFILPAPEAQPDWVHALSPTKRKAFSKLYEDIRSVLAARHKMLQDPKIPLEQTLRWLEYKASAWARPIRMLEIASAVTDTEAAIKHGPFILVPVPEVPRYMADEALDALDAAIGKVKVKCPKVLYGKLFVTKKIDEGVAAQYHRENDSLYLNVFAAKRFSDIHTIVHELGHRHDAKFLSKAGRDKYWALSTREPNPLHVTPYGGTKPSENYADGFAHFVLGMNMPAELAAILKEEIR